MNKPSVILVTGLPGSGKTTLAEKLGKKLNAPLISKDHLKELLFDSLGSIDREWSKKVGIAAYEIMDYFIEENLAAGSTIILESNFKPEFDNYKFKAWQEKFDYIAVQVICTATGETLFKRFKERAETGKRHVGHADAENLDEWRQFFATQKSKPLDVHGEIIEVDTNDFDKVDSASVIQDVERRLKKVKLNRP